MTVFYPDISAYEAGISLVGAPAVCIKVTEGTSWLSPDYGPALARAREAGTFAFAYHFLHQGNAAAQAAWCHQHAGAVPLMLDCEPAAGSSPRVADAAEFTGAYRALGGVITLLYLPRWYWGQLGSPSLESDPRVASLHLVSSVYTTYTDDPSGQGWLPYGGMTPAVWQYTSSQRFNGQDADFNAYRGTLAELKAVVTGSALPPMPPPPPPFPYPAGNYLGTPRPDPSCHSGYYGGPDTVNVHAWQARMAARGWAIVMDGCYGPASQAVCTAFQQEKGLAADGLVGPVTWGAAWTAPVT